MKNLRLNIPVILCLAGILCGCSQSKKNPDAEADITAVRAVLDRYIHAVNTNDLDLFMTCWADDARRMEPGFDVIVGNDKIKAHFKVMFDAFNASAEPYGEIEAGVSGDLAFTTVNAIISSTPKEGGPAIIADLKVVDVYKRQVDGSWQIYIDCINHNPKWSNESMSPESMEQDSSDPLL